MRLPLTAGLPVVSREEYTRGSSFKHSGDASWKVGWLPMQVLDQLAAFSSANSGVRVLVMPSVRDVHHHPVFPQPPLPAQPQLPSLINLPSPATLR
jgi:hypothetical protein